MKHSIHRVLLILCTATLPAMMLAANEFSAGNYSLPEEMSLEMVSDFNEPALTVRGNTIQIQNAQGNELEVYDITGKLIVSVAIDSNDKVVKLNLRKGFYIVKVGKLTRRISLP